LIYLDTSVVLAQVFAEDRLPPASLWKETLVSSRILEYEAWTRSYGRGFSAANGESLRWFLHQINFAELSAEVLARALEPFPKPLRTLDALHLATLTFLAQHGQAIRLASYDERQLEVATMLGIEAVALAQHAPAGVRLDSCRRPPPPTAGSSAPASSV
jgi:predicted nucleic acid-binding protein